MSKPTAITKGSLVYYVPATCHAFDTDATGNYTWQVGLKVQGRRQDEDAPVKALTAKEMKDFYAAVKRSNNPKQEYSRLVYLKPLSCWLAVVSAVGADGTYGLDIKAARPGVTLHYDGVKFDAGKAPHTFHECCDDDHLTLHHASTIARR